LDCIKLCAHRIESFQDGSVYPSSTYLMKQLPPAVCGFVSLLSSFYKGRNPDERESGRPTNFEWEYRHANTFKEWHEFAPPTGELAVHDLSDIPWYQQDYNHTA
jgi:hypothetical protein